MSGPEISVANSSVNRSSSMSLLGGPDSTHVNPSSANQVANQPGVVAPAQQDGAVSSLEQSAEVVGQPEINRQLLSEQIPVLTEIASRGGVSMPKTAAAFKEIEDLSNNKTIPKKTFSKLQKCNREFVSSVEALSKMKVSDVQVMFRTKKSTPCAKLFNTIEKCFADMDDQLVSLINNPDARSENIERLQEDCALMHSRLRNAVMSCADGDFDPDATIESVVNKVASGMSSSAGVLDAVKEELSPILTGLANASGQGGDTIQLGRVIADAEQALVTLQRIKNDGVEVNGGIIVPMQSDMEALIDTLQTAITNAKQGVTNHLAPGIEQSVQRLLISKDMLANLNADAKTFLKTEPLLVELLDVIDKCQNPIDGDGPDKILSASKLYTEPTDGAPSKSKLVCDMRKINDFIERQVPADNLRSAVDRMLFISRTIDKRCQQAFARGYASAGDNSEQLKAWSKLSEETRNELKSLMGALHSRFISLTRPGMMEDELNHLEQMVDIYSGKNSGQIRQSDYKAMLAGNLDAGTVVLTYASGLNHRHIDKEVCNAEITRRQQLGKGAVNDVQLLTYTGKDSTGQTTTYERVFKPAPEARVGLHLINTAKSIGFNGTQNAIQTNVGAQYIAEKIGAKNVISASRFGVVDGMPGILMDRGPGVKASDCRHQYATDFTFLPAEDQRTLRGNLMRELNRLQWADVLSGQMDRHRGNYMVYIDFDTMDVRVTGIDNDVCCGKNMVGMRKLRLPPANFERYFKGEELSTTQGIEKIVEGEPPQVTGYICDMMKMPVQMRNRLMEHNGAHAMTLPSVIDAEMARNIEGIDLDEYANDLREILQDEESVQAAVSRLKEAKAYVRELAEKGKVIDADAWHSSSTQQMIAKGQQEQVNTLLGSTKPPMRENRVYLSTHEFFWRDFKFLVPGKWVLPAKK